ncbi:MAG: hypothetical protein Kow0029_22870 [Candidatus Rifleibacteriota bacterium]
MSKKPPELTWQDKAILIAIPIVVFTIFILANYFTQDLTVLGAFEQQLPKAQVRDGGTIIQVYPQVATDSISCRLKARDSNHEYDFIFNITGSETMRFEVGRLVQFYGEYTYDPKGGKVEAPFKGKSGRMTGWAIYENRRYLPKEQDGQKNRL